MNCKKCNNLGTVILRKKDYYCEECFTINTNHKFRACIGKNKILAANENVLVCLSGGSGSTVLADLIHSGISMESHKKMRINVHFLHIITDTVSTNGYDRATRIIDLCQRYNFNVHIIHICEYMMPTSKIHNVNSIPTRNHDLEREYYNFIKNMPSTVSNDFLPKIKHILYIRYAKILECKFVFTGEPTTTLASNLLSNLALGRGSQIQEEIGFSDMRDDTVTIIRPMREITKEELDYYIKIKGLITADCEETKESSLQSVIKTFISDLQETFPATISTVYKTADKIGVLPKVQTKRKCALCQSDVGSEKTTLTALEATNFSRTVSNTKPIVGESSQDLYNAEEILNKSMFPFIHKTLCFSCSRNYSEIKCNLPDHIKNLLGN